MTPEDEALQKIDALLEQCGWIVQIQSEINLSAGSGIAVRKAALRPFLKNLKK
jgi:type I restriction enzyme, R subunit